MKIRDCDTIESQIEIEDPQLRHWKSQTKIRIKDPQLQKDQLSPNCILFWIRNPFPLLFKVNQRLFLHHWNQLHHADEVVPVNKYSCKSSQHKIFLLRSHRLIFPSLFLDRILPHNLDWLPFSSFHIRFYISHIWFPTYTLQMSAYAFSLKYPPQICSKFFTPTEGIIESIQIPNLCENRCSL